MKPLRLKLQAFGPYGREAKVDFRKLAARGGLFLIHGPTGGGKTSILDGMSFALFGSASGAERSAEGLRSDLAPGDLLTEASLEFAIGQDIYKVVRQPNQQIKKKRGDGFKSSGSTAQLEKMKSGTVDDLDHAEWELVISGAEKTTAIVGELLGMNEDQFRQVVVLPQGQFRKFLSATSKQREELLEKLFRSERYRSIAAELERRTKACADEAQQRRREQDAILGSLDVTSANELGEKLTSLESRLKEIETQATSLDERHRLALTALEDARSAARLLSDLKQCEERSQKLDLDKPRYEDNLQRLERHHQAATSAEQDRLTQNLKAETERIDADLAREKVNLEKAQSEKLKLESEKKQLEATRPDFEAANSELMALRSAYKQVELLDAEKIKAQAKTLEHASLQKSLEAKDASQARLVEQIAQHTARAEVLNKEVQQAATSLARLELINAQREDVKRVVEIEKKIATTQSALDVARGKQQASDKVLKVATEDFQRLQLSFYRNEAARLAALLEDGKPCPVCGSSAHPAPAHAEEVAPSQQDVKHAEAKVQKLSQDSTQVQIEVARLETELGESQRLLTDLKLKLTFDVASLEKEAKEHEAIVQRAKIAEKESQAERLAAETGTRELREAEEQMAELLKKRDGVLSELRDAESKVRGLEELLPENQRNLDAVKERGKLLAQKTKTFTDNEQALKAKQELSVSALASITSKIQTLEDHRQDKFDKLKSEEARLQELLHASGFKSLDEMRSSRLQEAQLKAAEESKRTYEGERGRIDGLLESLRSKVTSINNESRDLETREKEFSEAEALRKSIHGEEASIKKTISNLLMAKEKIDKLAQTIERAEARYRVAGRLSEVANGRPPNLTRVSLQRYVLSAKLDEVLEQASRRLFIMSRGRFHLKRADQAEDKRRTAGLDLEVEDSFTGTSRPTASLSGGEGFLASLSLALGLADVVQSQLGGVHLDAVFVDEGFGTLDSETLELAMKTLSELRAGGRIVGIISHVPELKEQIPDRLHVRKTASGSELSWDSDSLT